jgi:hypothetical protein
MSLCDPRLVVRIADEFQCRTGLRSRQSHNQSTPLIA